MRPPLAVGSAARRRKSSRSPTPCPAWIDVLRLPEILRRGLNRDPLTGESGLAPGSLPMGLWSPTPVKPPPTLTAQAPRRAGRTTAHCRTANRQEEAREIISNSCHHVSPEKGRKTEGLNRREISRKSSDTLLTPTQGYLLTATYLGQPLDRFGRRARRAVFLFVMPKRYTRIKLCKA